MLKHTCAHTAGKNYLSLISYLTKEFKTPNILFELPQLDMSKWTLKLGDFVNNSGCISPSADPDEEISSRGKIY